MYQVKLFLQDRIENLLPFDGTAIYYGMILTFQEAAHYYEALMSTIAWKNDEAKIFGHHYITPRKAAWYGDKAFPYTYSGTTKQALPWTPELLALKQLTEKVSGASYNSCLLNLYHTGDEGMAWHSDDETSLKKNGQIASISLGAERKFAFKHKSKHETVSILLEHGSLLVMKDETQTHWLHRLPPAKKVLTPRINLTFRQMMD